MDEGAADPELLQQKEREERGVGMMVGRWEGVVEGGGGG